MTDIWMDVDIALSEVPVNLLALLDDTDFKTREVAVAYNAAGMDLVWNFVTTGGAMTQTAVTPTTAGDYDWTHQGDGIYSIEIPASSGASINNDTEGFGWFTGLATGVLPWRGPVIGFRAAALNNALIDGGDLLDVNVTTVSDTVQTANDNGLDINAILVDTEVIGALGAGLTAVPWNSAWDVEVESEVADALAVYDPATHTELIAEIDAVQNGIAALNDLTAAAVADAVWDEAQVGHVGAGTFGLYLDTQVSGVGGGSAATIADAVWDEAISGHVGAGSFGEYVQTIPAPVAGATEWTNITVDDGVTALPGVDLWLSTDSGGSNVVWRGTTDASGNPKDVGNNNPWVDAGSYYVWCQLSGYTFTAVLQAAGTVQVISGTAVGAVGSVTMQSLIDAVQVDLGDSGAATWAEADLLQWLNDAIRDYSLSWPRQRSGTITAVTAQHKYDLPEDFMRVMTVEYPSGGTPPAYLSEYDDYVDANFWASSDYFAIVRRNDQDVDDGIWLSTAPGGAPGAMALEYLAYHPHNLGTGGFCTVPVEHHQLLRLYVAWRATVYLQAIEEATPTSNSSLLMSMLSQIAGGLRKDYLEDVARAGVKK